MERGRGDLTTMPVCILLKTWAKWTKLAARGRRFSECAFCLRQAQPLAGCAHNGQLDIPLKRKNNHTDRRAELTINKRLFAHGLGPLNYFALISTEISRPRGLWNLLCSSLVSFFVTLNIKQSALTSFSPGRRRRVPNSAPFVIRRLWESSRLLIPCKGDWVRVLATILVARLCRLRPATRNILLAELAGAESIRLRYFMKKASGMGIKSAGCAKDTQLLCQYWSKSIPLFFTIFLKPWECHSMSPHFLSVNTHKNISWRCYDNFIDKRPFDQTCNEDRIHFVR